MKPTKIRIKFYKTGRLKYIGHLDVLNLWNRAVKAAKLPVSYSKGFNPHMLMSFAAPLSLGLTSRAEYVDVDFDLDAEIDESLLERINANFPDGLAATAFYVLDEPYKKIAAIVTKAEYEITCPREFSVEQTEAFMRQGDVNIMKKTKRKNEITNIKEDIFALSVSGSTLFAYLSCGSMRNLKPELLIDAFCAFVAEAEGTEPLSINSFTIERAEIFGDTGGGNVPLSKI